MSPQNINNKVTHVKYLRNKLHKFLFLNPERMEFKLRKVKKQLLEVDEQRRELRDSLRFLDNKILKENETEVDPEALSM